MLTVSYILSAQEHIKQLVMWCHGNQDGITSDCEVGRAKSWFYQQINDGKLFYGHLDTPQKLHHISKS